MFKAIKEWTLQCWAPQGTQGHKATDPLATLRKGHCYYLTSQVGKLRPGRAEHSGFCNTRVQREFKTQMVHTHIGGSTPIWGLSTCFTPPSQGREAPVAQVLGYPPLHNPPLI